MDVVRTPLKNSFSITVNNIWWLVRATLVVAFGFLPEIFWKRWGPTGKVNPKYLNKFEW